MYRAVIFDFGNVLCRINRNAFSEALTAYCPYSAPAISAMLWGGELEIAHETGKIDSRDYFRKVIELTGASDSLDYGEFCVLYARILEPNPDGIAALEYARSRGLRTFLLSNISFLHATWIFNNEILATIPELHILSYKIGVMKPDPLIWKRLLEYSGLDAADCLYVDDIPAYCEAARSLGFASLNYDFRSQKLLRELENVL